MTFARETMSLTESRDRRVPLAMSSLTDSDLYVLGLFGKSLLGLEQ